jgi:hypothetical protein
MLRNFRKGDVGTTDRQVIIQGVVQVCLQPEMVAEREHVIGKRLMRKRVVVVTLLWSIQEARIV